MIEKKLKLKTRKLRYPFIYFYEKIICEVINFGQKNCFW